jgi:hypothetical protein
VYVQNRTTAAITVTITMASSPRQRHAHPPAPPCPTQQQPSRARFFKFFSQPTLHEPPPIRGTRVAVDRFCYDPSNEALLMLARRWVLRRRDPLRLGRGTWHGRVRATAEVSRSRRQALGSAGR